MAPSPRLGSSSDRAVEGCLGGRTGHTVPITKPPAARLERGELNARMKDLPPATDDDQSRTFDGRVLDTKEKVLEFLAEMEQARKDGRSLDPCDRQP